MGRAGIKEEVGTSVPVHTPLDLTLAVAQAQFMEVIQKWWIEIQWSALYKSST